MRFALVTTMLILVFCVTFGGAIVGALNYWWILATPMLCIGVCGYEAAEIFSLRHSFLITGP